MPKMPKFLRIKLIVQRIRSIGLRHFSWCGDFLSSLRITQALQLYVLSKGSVEVGALTMLAFSVGTLRCFVTELFRVL